MAGKGWEGKGMDQRSENRWCKEEVDDNGNARAEGRSEEMLEEANEEATEEAKEEAKEEIRDRCTGCRRFCQGKISSTRWVMFRG
jgi:hypothetical protein